MSRHTPSILNRKHRYLQIAFNSTLEDAAAIIAQLPENDRIILEAGTPLIKRYGISAVRSIKNWCEQQRGSDGAYVVADLKTMDRGATEVAMAASAGASAVVALASAPTETINTVISACQDRGIDSMLDMMNVEYPLAVLSSLRQPPSVVILHRGVDEEALNREKQIPFHEIQRIKGSYDVLIAIAGGDTIREVARAFFNDADIAVIWKSVYQQTPETLSLVNEFLKQIR